MPGYYDMMRAWMSSQEQQEEGQDLEAAPQAQEAIADLDLEHEAASQSVHDGHLPMHWQVPSSLPMGGIRETQVQEGHTPTSVGSPAASSVVSSGRRAQPRFRSSPYD